MGYAGKLEEKVKAQELRSLGLSYGEISLQIKVSKDTLSRWCKDIILNEEQKLRLMKNKELGQRKGSLVAAENKRSKRIKRTNEIYAASSDEVGELSKRDRFAFGVALYAGEGTKSDGKGGFVNADPLLIKFMAGWFQEFCKIPIDEMRGSIWLHEESSEAEAKQYWSKISGIPINQFHKTYQVKSSPDSQKIRKNIHSYGVFSIKFYRSDTQRKIMGWISAFLDAKIAKLSNEHIP